jgi:hypothetical protein
VAHLWPKSGPDVAQRISGKRRNDRWVHGPRDWNFGSLSGAARAASRKPLEMPSKRPTPHGASPVLSLSCLGAQSAGRLCPVIYQEFAAAIDCRTGLVYCTGTLPNDDQRSESRAREVFD